MLELGNLDAARDWGFAGDYVEGMWQMLQQEPAEDFVLATGESHTVRDFVAAAAARLGFDLGLVRQRPRRAGDRPPQRPGDRAVNPAFYRPVDVATLVGNAAKARTVLGWQPRTGFEELVGT